MVMAVTTRSAMTFRLSSYYILFSKRFLSSSSSITKAPPLPGWLLSSRPIRTSSLAFSSSRRPRRSSCECDPLSCKSLEAAYSPLNSDSNFSDRPPTEMAPLFPGWCDYEHWLIVMDKPGGEGASKQQMIDCYIQTLAKVLGSEEKAKQKIYNVSCERYFGFGCEVDEETSAKLEELPGVLFVLPDSYVDVEIKDYMELGYL